MPTIVGITGLGLYTLMNERLNEIIDYFFTTFIEIMEISNSLIYITIYNYTFSKYPSLTLNHSCEETLHARKFSLL